MFMPQKTPQHSSPFCVNLGKSATCRPMACVCETFCSLQLVRGLRKLKVYLESARKPSDAAAEPQTEVQMMSIFSAYVPPLCKLVRMT